MKRIAKTLAILLTLALCFTLVLPTTAEAKTKAVKKPVKVTSVKKSAVTTSTIKLTYKKATRAKGYQIQYSTKSNMKSAKTVKTTKRTATIKNLKANTTYYVRVRAYNTSAKKKTQYGAWSSKIKVKTATAKKAAKTHTHTWVTKTVVDTPATTKTEEVAVGLIDTFGRIYPSLDAYNKASKEYMLAATLAKANGTECTVEPVGSDPQTIYETRTVTVPAVTHTETVCSVCGQKK